MVGRTEKGKIPRGEWATILARYRSGETIADIGRAYGCTPPAIRYIIKRSDASTRSAGNATAEEDATPAARARAMAGQGASARPSGLAVGLAPHRMLSAETRSRVSGDIASFLVALDQSLVEGTSASAADLQDAADRLMRSIARIRLELERFLAGGQPATSRSRGLKAPGTDSEHKA
jgi:hypothetical protein